MINMVRLWLHDLRVRLYWRAADAHTQRVQDARRNLDAAIAAAKDAEDAAVAQATAATRAELDRTAGVGGPARWAELRHSEVSRAARATAQAEYARAVADSQARNRRRSAWWRWLPAD